MWGEKKTTSHTHSKSAQLGTAPLELSLKAKLLLLI